MMRRSVAIALVILSNVQVGSAQTFSGAIRARVENWNWFETTAGNSSYTYGGILLRGAIADQKPSWSWRLEAAAPVLLGLPEDAIAPAPGGQLGGGASYWQASDSADNAASIFVKQAFVRIGKPVAQGGHSVRLGRFEFVEGAEFAAKNPTIAVIKRDRIAHRLIGNFGWTHVQRSYDGLHYAFDRSRLNVTATALRPTRGVFDVDGSEGLNVGLAYAAVNGASGSDVADWRVFAIHYLDHRDDPRPLKTDNRAAAARLADTEDIAVSTMGGHYTRIFNTGAGAFDVMFWGALQRGEWGMLDHRAHGFSVEAGLQPKVLQSWKPWLRIGMYQGSGDEVAADDEHQTFFQMTPTPRIYARFPFYNLMNIEDAFVSLLLRPSPRFTLRADVRRLDLAEPTDLRYAGGGAFEPETFGYAGRPANLQTSLATLVDLSADFRVNDRISVNGYVATAKGGDVIERIYSGRNATLGYLEVELRK